MITARTRPPVPADALALNEDIIALTQCKNLLATIDPRNIADDPDEGYKRLRMARAQIGVCWRHAWDKMRTDYLAPVRRKIERPRKSAVK